VGPGTALPEGTAACSFHWCGRRRTRPDGATYLPHEVIGWGLLRSHSSALLVGTPACDLPATRCAPSKLSAALAHPTLPRDPRGACPERGTRPGQGGARPSALPRGRARGGSVPAARVGGSVPGGGPQAHAGAGAECPGRWSWTSRPTISTSRPSKGSRRRWQPIRAPSCWSPTTTRSPGAARARSGRSLQGRWRWLGLLRAASGFTYRFKESDVEAGHADRRTRRR
jgi:hypothetical protein